MRKNICLIIVVFCIISLFSIATSAKIGDVLGYAKYTDISAYINNYPIKSFNINDYTAIVVEDLRNYGFDVVWNGYNRTLTVTKNSNATIVGSPNVYKYSYKAGQNSFAYVETDIVTYIEGQPVQSFNIGGQTCIYMDVLGIYGGIEWSQEIRAIKLSISDFPSKAYQPIQEVPTTTMYSATGATIVVENSEVAAYSNVGWYLEPVAVPMSSSEIPNAKSVNYIHQRKVSYYENENLHRLFFGFKNRSGSEMYAPALVHIKIVNDVNETVYNKSTIVGFNDFENWTQYSASHYLASVKILQSEITPGNSTQGKLYFTVKNPGYFSFDEDILSIYDLPKIKLSDSCSLQLPAIPKTLHDYGYDKKIDSSYRITNISYKFEDAYDNEVRLYLYFDGEKYYDKDGHGQSSTCQVGWKLYDMQGYVVKNGTFYSPALNMGEKFRNEEEYIYDLKPGNYKLEILSTNERFD